MMSSIDGIYHACAHRMGRRLCRSSRSREFALLCEGRCGNSRSRTGAGEEGVNADRSSQALEDIPQGK